MGYKTSKSIIDFANYISERTAGFTGREWVFQAVNDWLATSNASRFFLLIGEPGSGKTAIASRLAQISQGTVPPLTGLSQLTSDFLSAQHFCSAYDSRWINPSAFAESIALQLAERYPAYAKALTENSGDRQIHIEVQQRIEQGQAVGVFINRLSVNGSTPEDVFNCVVREPLEALFRDGFDQQIVILIDGLDEALEYSGSMNIISLLTHLNKLPSAVHFLLTSRRDVWIENAFLDADELVLSAALYEQQNQEDIRRYVKDRLGNDEKLIMKVAELDVKYTSERVVETIVKKAEGNFLYTRFLLDAIAGGKRSLIDVEGLPEGLDGLYFESLQRVVRLRKGEWYGDYAPLIGMLSVTQESPTLAQFQSFTKQSTTKVLKHLNDLGQFVTEIKSANGEESRYRLYHQSVSDFLHSQSLFIRKKELRNIFYLSEDEWHKALADWCERGDLTAIWEDTMLDQGERGRRMYARRFYIMHLYRAHAWKRLFDVLDDGAYGRAKLRYDPSTHSLAQDLELGQRVAAWGKWTLEEGLEHLPHLWRYTLLRCSLTSRVDTYPDAAFELLLLLNREGEAVRNAELLADAAHRFRAFSLIANVFITQPERRREGLQLFEQAYESIQFISSRPEKEEALWKLGQALTLANCWQQAQEVIISINDDEKSVEALCALGQALADADHWQQAQEVIISINPYSVKRDEALRVLGLALADAKHWQQAQEVIASIQNSEKKAEALCALGKTLADAKHWQQAQEVIASIQDSEAEALSAVIYGEKISEMLAESLARSNQWRQAVQVWWRARALCALGQALIQANQEQQAILVWQQAQEVIVSIQDSEKRAGALTELGEALAKANQEQQAILVWQQAQEVIVSIQDSEKRAGALTELGEALAKANQEQQAILVWQQAQEVISSSSYYYSDRDRALMLLSKAQARTGHWQQSQETIASIQDSEKRAEALQNLGQAMMQANQEQQAVLVWQQSQETIASIQDSEKRAEALQNLGQAMMQANQEQQAVQVWQQAALVWQQAQEPGASAKFYQKGTWALRNLGLVLAEANRWQQAQEAISSIRDGSLRGWALSALVEKLAEANHWQQAQEVIASIQYSDWRATALSTLGEALVKANQKQQASLVWQQDREAIASIPEKNRRDWALCRLGEALAQAKDWQQAKETINSITDGRIRVEALCSLGKSLALANQEELATLVWQQVQSEIMSIGYSVERVKRSEELSALGQRLAVANHWQQAWEVIAFISDNGERAKVLCTLGIVFVLANQEQQAALAWQQAQEMVVSIQDNEKRDQALVMLFQRLADVNYWQQAQEVIVSISDNWKRDLALNTLGQRLAGANYWEQAQEVIASIHHSDIGAEALLALGQALMQANQEQQAIQVWQRAWEVITSIHRNDIRDWALRDLGKALIQANQERQTTQVWQQAQEVIASIHNDKERANELQNLGKALIQANQEQQAIQVQQQAQETIASMLEKPWRDWMLQNLDQALVQANQEQQDVQVWQQAQEMIASIQDSETRAEMLLALGQALTQANQEQKAIKVWQQAQEVIVSIHDYIKRVKTLSALGIVLARANHWEQTQEVIASIPEDAWRWTHHWEYGREHPFGEELWKLIKALADANHWQQAQEVIALIKHGNARIMALCKLSEALADANHWQQAQEVIASIRDSKTKVEVLCTLGKALALANQEQQTVQVCQQAQDLIWSFTYSGDSDKVLSALGEILALAEHWQQAQEVIMSIKYSETRDEALCALGEVLALAEHWQQAWEVIVPIQDGEKRDGALSKLGKALAEAKNWQQAQNVIMSIEYNVVRDEALSKLGEALAEAKNWQQAQEVIMSIYDSSGKTQALIKLCHTLIQSWHQGLFCEINTIQEKNNFTHQLNLLLQCIWVQLKTSHEAFTAFSLACGPIILKPTLASSFFQVFGWIDASLTAEDQNLVRFQEAQGEVKIAIVPSEATYAVPSTNRFDKFTESARKALTLALEEAQRFQHNYIGTEHLLLGLVREGEGVAAKVLSSLNVELDKVRSAVEFIIGRGDHTVLGEIGLTPRAKKVIELAVDEARLLNHQYIGTEHLLLGLLREGEGIVAGILEHLGINLEDARTQTIQVLS